MLNFDILIKNANILTMNSQMNTFENGFIGIEKDKIVYLGIEKPEATSKTIIDAKNNIVMPGLINAHTHSGMTMFRGVADDLSLMNWLNNYIWPLEDKFVTEKNIKTASKLAIAEMILSGTTTFNDMYFFTGVTAENCKDIGMRAVLGEAVIDFPASVKKTSEEYFLEFINEYENDNLIIPSIVPHSPYSCSEGLLKRIKKLSDEKNLPVHIHISETTDEVKLIKEKTGMTPVEYLDSINFLNEKTVAVHCVHLTDNDMNILKNRNVGIVNSPESNLKLASGIAEVPKMIKKGLTVSLGTDGPASNNNLDMFEEMSLTVKIHKALNDDSTIMNAKEVLRMGTINGAKVIGIDNITGSLEIGKKADLIIIDINKPHLTPMYDPYSHLTYSANGSDVDTVIINGKIILKNRKFTNFDLDKVMLDIKHISNEIIAYKNNGMK
ncbi:MAG: amidohydrolase [Candidatus Delongbacteria bacterium]|jgi:5-methylthioadenosine/S-adenosylhomocysteine deaminase|nr:amidohydrolase [Candidatus Delongbacteria bacterium]